MTLSMLQRARRYRRLGFSVFPLDHPDEPKAKDPDDIGKVPTVMSWKPFQARHPEDADLDLWFGNGHFHNLALVTGAISQMVAIDTDNAEGEAWAAANLPATPFKTRTSKGLHRLFRHPGPEIKVPNKVRIRSGVDVRGDGGYVVAPGSLHATRVEYAEVEPWPDSIDAAPVFDMAWLPASASDAETTNTAPRITSPPLPTAIGHGVRNDTLTREAGRVRRLGWTQKEIAAALHAINLERCHPPEDRQKVEAIAHSVMRYDPVEDKFPLTEAGDAEFFAAINADTVRYDHRRARWLLFDEHYWAPQTDGAIYRLALEAVRARQAAAMKIDNADLRKRHLKWATDGEARKRQSNLLALAQNVRPIADAGDNWDLDPWLLGVPNGVIDLRTGMLRPGRPEDRITMQARAPFDPDATSPLWDATIAAIFDHDTQLISYFDRYVGYSLTGDCREETLAFCWGGGANGKGTLMNTISWLLGDYADDLPFSTLEQSRYGGGIPNDLAKLVSKRFVTSSETAETRRLNEARVKALTGRDPITARFLHREFFTFQPVAKFWLATNQKPVVRDTSVGFWRRIHLIPFTQSFAGKPNLQLKDQLREEAVGILGRAVRGSLAWQREGLNPPAAVLEATKEYREDSLPLSRFMSECCVLGEEKQANFGMLFDAYRKWCQEAHEESRLSRKEFIDALHARFRSYELERRVTFMGIGLIDGTRRDDTSRELGLGQLRD